MPNVPSNKVKFVGLLGALFFLALATVWVRTATVKRTYQYVQNERSLKQLERDYQRRRVEWLRLTTPERLEKMALALNLHAPKAGQLIRYASSPKTSKK